MKLTLAYLLAICAVGNALPQAAESADHSLAAIENREFSPSDSHDLFKRKGGGGGGRSGGGGGSTSSGGGSTSSGGGGSSSSRPAGSSTSSSGGSSRGGSGVAPAYGGGTYYSGGARTPYTSGGRSPGGISPVFLPVAALAVFPGIWLYGAYAYPYSRPYTYHNASSNANETKPVECLCAQYQVCGCDENANSTFMYDLIGNGSVADFDDTVRVANVNGTSTILVNGTLANGTTADSFGVKGVQSMLELSGYWIMAATVAATIMMS